MSRGVSGHASFWSFSEMTPKVIRNVVSMYGRNYGTVKCGA